MRGGNIWVIERPVGVSLLRVSEWVNKLVFVQGKGLGKVQQHRTDNPATGVY